MAQGVAWMARELGVPAHDRRPGQRVDDEARCGRAPRRPDRPRHRGRSGGRRSTRTTSATSAKASTASSSTPSRIRRVMAGNGTIGLELAEELDDFDAVLIPWGGGGLTTGIASALRAVGPTAKVYVCEPESGAPFDGGRRERARPGQGRLPPSFIDGAGLGLAAPEDVGARTRPRHRCVRRSRSRTRRRACDCCSSVRASSARAQPALARRGGDGRARRCRASRLHRLGREHRLREARDDSRRPRPRLVDQRSLEPGDGLALEARDAPSHGHIGASIERRRARGRESGGVARRRPGRTRPGTAARPAGGRSDQTS